MKTITLKVDELEHRRWKISAMQDDKLFGEWLLEKLRKGAGGLTVEEMKEARERARQRTAKQETRISEEHDKPVEQKVVEPVKQKPVEPIRQKVDPPLAVPANTVGEVESRVKEMVAAKQGAPVIGSGRVMATGETTQEYLERLKGAPLKK